MVWRIDIFKKTASMFWLVFLPAVFSVKLANAQDTGCNVEIYLLKKHIVSTDSTGMMTGFTVERSDLQDTAFIKNEEIHSFSITLDTMKLERGVPTYRVSYVFSVDTTVAKRVRELNIPLCCGRQFALVTKDRVTFAGYLWNGVSSFGCDGITAFAFGDKLYIGRKLPDDGLDDPSTDPRKSNELMSCLKATGRLANTD